MIGHLKSSCSVLLRLSLMGYSMTKSRLVSASNTSRFSIRLFSPLNRLRCWHSDGVSSGRELFHPIVRLLLVMACCALVAGITGFFLANHRLLSEPEWMSPVLTPSNYPRFMAGWFAHSASYAERFPRRSCSRHAAISMTGPSYAPVSAQIAAQPIFGPEDSGLDGRKARLSLQAI